MMIERCLRIASYILMVVCVILAVVTKDWQYYIAEFGIFALFVCGSYNRDRISRLEARVKELENGK